jgi:recombination DNA repair RAD52 pathway protein
MSSSDLFKALSSTLPRDAVRRLPSGQDYVSSHWVISRLNEVFGPMGWSITYGAPAVLAIPGARPVYHVPATMVILGGPLTGDGVTRADVGVGISATDKPEGVETAIKAAYTDALKRCARTLGPSFGLALYEKERTTVGASSVAQNLLDEIEALNNADDCDAWVRQRGEVLKGLHADDRLVVKAAFAERRQPFLAAKSAADMVIDAIEATRTREELAAVRKQHAVTVRAMSPADIDKVKTAANERDKAFLEVE